MNKDMVNEKNRSMSKDDLMNRIDALSFAMTETQLFLDTHPDCPTALDYYRRLRNELDEAMTDYQNRFSPLFADAISGEKWSWIDGAWPWQMGNGNMSKNKDGRKAEGEKR